MLQHLSQPCFVHEATDLKHLTVLLCHHLNPAQLKVFHLLSFIRLLLKPTTTHASLCAPSTTTLSTNPVLCPIQADTSNIVNQHLLDSIQFHPLTVISGAAKVSKSRLSGAVTTFHDAINHRGTAHHLGDHSVAARHAQGSQSEILHRDMDQSISDD